MLFLEPNIHFSVLHVMHDESANNLSFLAKNLDYYELD